MGAIETLMEQVMEQGQEQIGQPKKVVRKYSAAFKASVVAECGQPGVTKAEIARKYGIHTSVMYRWVGQMKQAHVSVSPPQEPPTTASVPSSAQAVGPTREQATEQTTAATGLPRGFIPIATAAPSSEVIHIQVQSAASQLHIRWPSSAAAQCVQWMRDGLAVLLLPQGKDATQELRPDKPPPDGAGGSAQSTAAWRAVRGMR